MTTDTQIRALIEKHRSALSNKDVDGVLSLYTDDGTTFSLAPPLKSNWTAKSIDSWFATWKGPIGMDLQALRVEAGEDIAFCHGFNHMTGTKTDGQAVDLWFRVTLCFRRVNGAWKICHEHESVPFYMDGSVRAALDLKP